MLEVNAEHLADAAAVETRFGISRRALGDARRSGRAIACRRGQRYIYPVEQFAPGAIEPWAAALIAITGNGAAALHYFWVRRRSLGWRSFATLLRSGRNHDRVVQRMLDRAKSLIQ
jgi:hypothetical protein